MKIITRTASMAMSRKEAGTKSQNSIGRIYSQKYSQKYSQGLIMNMSSTTSLFGTCSTWTRWSPCSLHVYKHNL